MIAWLMLERIGPNPNRRQYDRGPLVVVPLFEGVLRRSRSKPVGLAARHLRSPAILRSSPAGTNWVTVNAQDARLAIAKAEEANAEPASTQDDGTPRADRRAGSLSRPGGRRSGRRSPRSHPAAASTFPS